MENFTFGDLLKELIESTGIEVIPIQRSIVTINGESRILEFSGSQNDIEIIKQSLEANISFEELKQLEKDGIEINFLNENGCSPYSKELVSSPEALLYKGRRVLLYIIKGNSKSRSRGNEPKSYHKYHLHYCDTLKRQKMQNSLSRYRVSLRTDGLFKYQYFGEQYFSEQKLLVCGNCLRDLTDLAVRERDKFNLQNFLMSSAKIEEYSEVQLVFDGIDVSGMDTDFNSLPDKYRDEWREISIARKKSANYTCQECSWKPNSDRQKRFIHTHHLDKNKSNNLSDNLKVLCIDCHFNYHPTNKGNLDHSEFIKMKNASVTTVINIENYTKNNEMRKKVSFRDTNSKAYISQKYEQDLYNELEKNQKVSYFIQQAKNKEIRKTYDRVKIIEILY